MVHRIVPGEVFAFAEKGGWKGSRWVLARETLRARIARLREAGFDKVWFAVKACPLAELAEEAVAAGAGLMLTFAGEARQFGSLLSGGASWGFSVRDAGSRHDLKWVLNRFSPDWVSLGDEEDTRIAIPRIRASHKKGICLFRVKPPPNVRTACGLYGFAVDAVVEKARGCRPAGIHFHIGSNKSSVLPYMKMLRCARDWWDTQKVGWREPQVLNIGGGFATCYGHFKKIAEEGRRLFPESELWIEPGRYLAQRSLYWVARCRLSGEEIQVDGCVPVSMEARRPPYRVNAILLPERLTTGSTAIASGENPWTALTAEIVRSHTLRVIQRSTPKDIPPGQATIIIYDCAAYSHRPADPVIILEGGEYSGSKEETCALRS